ncbi:5'-nucleotidase C-terminal domain-containing protein [Neolewinella persica]|uniref:5'-nucleotidase C-terminal domain-containing protein n=1 Tax=Neolewinella persica TaxID=70998 RepID=UPI0003672B25|nr:5'-nucleotidase C-terminal domain-containing protein [Neolewinella persica]
MRNLLYIFLLLLGFGCRAPLSSPTVQPRFYSVSDKLEADQAGPQVQRMVSTIAPYKAQLDDKMNRQLATVKTPLKKGQPESTLGNWVADLFAQAAAGSFPDRNIVFATLNQGGIRVGEIGTGPLLVSEIYELMPFDNELVLMELNGKVFKEFISHIANDGGWPVSAGLSVISSGSGLDVKIGGKAIDPNQVYTIALPDYVANGGSNTSMLKELPKIKSGLLIRDLLIEYAEKITDPISIKVEGKRMKL